MDIKKSYRITLSDYRKAYYFGTIQRHLTGFRIAAGVLLIGILYNVAVSLKVIPDVVPFFNFLVIGYAVWLLLVLGNVEKAIRLYIKNPENFIGTTYIFEKEGKHISFSVPEKNATYRVHLDKLAAVYDTSFAFMVYLDGASLYLLPHRVLEKEENEELRTLFQKSLKEKFRSRYIK